MIAKNKMRLPPSDFFYNKAMKISQEIKEELGLKLMTDKEKLDICIGCLKAISSYDLPYDISIYVKDLVKQTLDRIGVENK